MRRARFLPSSSADLIAILDYVADAGGSVAAAKNFVSKLRMRCNELAHYETIVGRGRNTAAASAAYLMVITSSSFATTTTASR